MFIVGNGNALQRQLEVRQCGHQTSRMERIHSNIDSSLNRRWTRQRLDVDHVNVDDHAC